MLKLNILSGRVIEQLELPVPLDEFKRKVDEIRLAGQPNTAPTVLSVDSSVPALSWHLQQTALDNDPVLQELNQLAEVINGMDAAGYYHLNKALSTDHKQSLDMIHHTAIYIRPSSTGCYEVIPGITTHEDLGKWLVEHDRLEGKTPEILRPYLNYRSMGVDYCNDHDGEILSGGYVGIREGAMEQFWDEQSLLQLTLATSKGTFSINLPAATERMDQAKRALDLEDFAETSITDIKLSTPYQEAKLPLCAITVEDANTLAMYLEMMEQEDGDLKKFLAVLEVEQPDTFTEVVRIAMNRDDYEQIPEDMDEYGKQMLRRIGADDEVIDTIDGYMDFARLGEDSMAEDGVRRTEFGLVRRLSSPFPPGPEIGQTMM